MGSQSKRLLTKCALRRLTKSVAAVAMALFLPHTSATRPIGGLQGNSSFGTFQLFRRRCCVIEHLRETPPNLHGRPLLAPPMHGLHAKPPRLAQIHGEPTMFLLAVEDHIDSVRLQIRRLRQGGEIFEPQNAVKTMVLILSLRITVSWNCDEDVHLHGAPRTLGVPEGIARFVALVERRLTLIETHITTLLVW